MDGNDICPIDDSVDSSAILKGYCIPDVGEFPVFKEEEIIFFRKFLKFRYQCVGKW